jgi:hypothetical protein
MARTAPDYRHRRLGQRRRLYSVEEVSQWIGCKPDSLRDNRYRTRLGLPAIRIASRLMFDEADIEALIERRRETLPIMPRSESDNGQ